MNILLFFFLFFLPHSDQFKIILGHSFSYLHRRRCPYCSTWRFFL
jgi:hypothetical protein